MRSMSEEGLAKLTKPWEEFVSYPYDDKVPPRIINGKRTYVEYKGGEIKGTITQGWGHTDAAGAPKIEIGSRWTQDYGDQVLLDDMAPCERRVNSLLKVAVTQHQADTLYDLDFNCTSAIPHVVGLVNAGDWPGAERVMMQYVNSKGERMVGLVHRRTAEITWANTPDEATTQLPSAAESDSPDIYAPKAERAPPPRAAAQSHSIAASATVGAGGMAEIIRALNETAEPLKQAKQNMLDIFGDGFLTHSALDILTPRYGVLLGIVLVVAGAFLLFDRLQRMRNDHV